MTENTIFLRSLNTSGQHQSW